MDFNDTPAEAAFRMQARSFLEAHCKPRTSHSYARGGEPSASYLERARAYQRAKAQAGFAGLTWPQEHGGRGLSPIYQVIFGQEEGRFEAPSAPFAIGLGMCLPTLLAFGADADKRRYAPTALQGEEIWCQLFSEPAAGSDVAGIRTKASRDGDDWVINGQKVWTSGAHFSDFGLLLARTDPGQPKHKGLTMFFLNMRSPGVEVRPIHQASGDSQFNEVFFTDVRIPDSQRLGDPGQGWSVALVTLMNERLAVGASPGPDYAEMLQLARTLPGPGGGDTPLLQDQGFRRRLADWYISAEGYNLGRFRTMTALSRGETPGAEASIGKLLNANRLQDLSRAALDYLGPAGLVLSEPEAAAFQRGYLWAPGLRIAGGTDEILKNIIAERILGLPGEPRVDKDIPFRDLPSGI